MEPPSQVSFGSIRINSRKASPAHLAFSSRLKRALDLAAAWSVVIGFAPFFAMLILLVSIDGGPVLYAQKRIGRGGRAFRCWKFRTMVVGADRILKELLARDESARVEYETYWKLKDDPRITFVGRFLRRYSLDELPQIFNVIRGDMSLVGPRPRSLKEMQFFETKMPDLNSAYKSVKPGLTGLWQVNGRNHLSLDSKAHLDAYYAKNWSVRGDLQIIVATVPVIINGKGAF